MKKLLFLLLLLPMHGQDSDFDDRIVKFFQLLDSWRLEYQGCSQHPRTDANGIPLDCTGTGNFNVATWKKAGKLAHQLWPDPEP